MSDSPLLVRLASGVTDVPKDSWNALAGADNPFVSHEFLSVMEESGSVDRLEGGSGTGWQSAPLLLENEAGSLLGAVPAYLKGHSQGEYVFDHAWADAYERAGGQYYPKLQIAAPFTPATGPRLLLADNELAPALLSGIEQFCAGNGISGAHATFVEPAQVALFAGSGWLERQDIQFHWTNRDYASFDGFLADLASRKRKGVRKERAAAQYGLRIERLSGDDIGEHHWDVFWRFYQDTGSRKWGTPYLTREAFSLLGERMGDRIVLVLASDGDGVPVAGALNFLGADALYGRYWGCAKTVRFLHFELCYYQAIDIAIERGLSRVEAGAQGGHKLARGYEPVVTRSMHWVSDPGFRAAIEDFLQRERSGIEVDALYLGERTPFRKG